MAQGDIVKVRKDSGRDVIRSADNNPLGIGSSCPGYKLVGKKEVSFLRMNRKVVDGSTHSLCVGIDDFFREMWLDKTGRKVGKEVDIKGAMVILQDKG